MQRTSQYSHSSLQKRESKVPGALQYASMRNSQAKRECSQNSDLQEFFGEADANKDVQDFAVNQDNIFKNRARKSHHANQPATSTALAASVFKPRQAQKKDKQLSKPAKHSLSGSIQLMNQ